MSSVAANRSLTPNQQARRHRILTAARELVAQHGYDGMIMRDVATSANVSPTTLYNLYNTKDELLMEALRESVSESWELASADAPELGFARLMIQLRHSVRQTIENTAYAQAITQALLRANPGDSLVENLLQRNARAVRASLLAMAEQSQLRDDQDLDDLAITMVGTFWSTYMLWNKGVIELDDLEAKLRRCYLSCLLPASQGDLKRDIEQQLHAL